MIVKINHISIIQQKTTGRDYSHGRPNKWPPPVKFYNKDEDYYEFTNFYMRPVCIDKYSWPSTEHYFQAQKFIGTPYMEEFISLGSPREAFEMSRRPDLSKWKRPDWEDVKQLVMYKALLEKFGQHEDLKKLLVGTGSRQLIENSPYDSYWGCGRDGSGSNHLGILLMEVRACLYSCKCVPSPNASMSVASMSGHNGSYKVANQISQTADQVLATQTDNNQASLELMKGSSSLADQQVITLQDANANTGMGDLLPKITDQQSNNSHTQPFVHSTSLVLHSDRPSTEKPQKLPQLTQQQKDQLSADQPTEQLPSVHQVQNKLSEDQPSAEDPPMAQQQTDKLSADQSTTEKPPLEQQQDQLSADQSTTEKPPLEQQQDQLSADQSTTEKPPLKQQQDQVSADQSTTEKPPLEQQQDQLSADQSTTEKPPLEQQQDQLSADQSTTEKPPLKQQQNQLSADQSTTEKPPLEQQQDQLSADQSTTEKPPLEQQQDQLSADQSTTEKPSIRTAARSGLC